MLSTSPRPGGAANVLNTAKTSAPHFGGDLKADVSVPSFFDKFDSEAEEISNPEIKASLMEALAKLV